MPLFTLIARITDCMPLVASFDTKVDESLMENFKDLSKAIIRTLNAPRPTPKCAIDSGDYCFCYEIEDGVCYLTISSKVYPRRLAFSFLDDVHKQFIDQQRLSKGENYLDFLQTVDRPYAFVHFEKVISKIRKRYANPQSDENLQRLNEELQDIHSIMRKNITDVLERGGKLEQAAQISENLLHKSKQFSWGTKKLSFDMMVRKYAPFAAVGVLVTLLLYLLY